MCQISTLQEKLKEAISRAYEQDIQLLEKRTERPFVFRVGLYLNELIKDCLPSNTVIDCEYNRNMDDPKRLPNDTICTPDLLIHSRDRADNNFLAVEFKGYWNNDNNDTNKLKELTNPNGIYKYRLGVFVKLESSEARYLFFCNGEDSNSLNQGL
jgi:hypothetical protein